MREPKGALAFAGDWHGNEFWAVPLIYELGQKHEVDTILHAGDFGYDFELNFRDALEEACIFNDIMIYFVDGNHDDHGWLWNKPTDEDGLYVVSDHVRCIPRGHRWQWWGKTFIGIGGAVSVDKYHRVENVSWWSTETVTQANYEKSIEGGKVDVWLSHDCPGFIPIPGIIPGDNNGWPADLIRLAENHRHLLYQIYDLINPSLIVHGHYHIRYSTRFRDTAVIGLDCDGSSLNNNCIVVPDKAALECLTSGQK